MEIITNSNLDKKMETGNAYRATSELYRNALPLPTLELLL